MTTPNEARRAGDAAGLDNNAFPGGNSNSDIAQNPAHMQQAISALRREFVIECLRIASIKASHGADNLEVGDILAAERDILIVVAHVKEAAKAFRELEALTGGGNG